MHRGSTSKQGAAAWRPAMRRAAILGGVAVLHLALMLLVRLPPCRPDPSSIRSDDALRIRFFPSSPRPPGVRRKMDTMPPPPVRDHRAARGVELPGVLPASPPSSVAVPLITAMPPDYRRGTFDTDLAGAQPSGKFRLPGSEAPWRTGIRLRARSSMKDVVRAMTVGNRCKYERMKMKASATQFITPQLMDRALDADGCGPQGKRTPADDAIEAASRRAIPGE